MRNLKKCIAVMVKTTVLQEKMHRSNGKNYCIARKNASQRW